MKKIQILNALVWACLAAFSCGQGSPPSPDAHPAQSARETHEEKNVVCPVCGLVFKQKDAAGSVEINGKKYFFYLEDHLKAFKADPTYFLETD